MPMLKDKRKIYDHDYYLSHRDELLTKTHQYHKAHRDERLRYMAQYNREYYQHNKEYIKEQRRNRRRPKKDKIKKDIIIPLCPIVCPTEIVKDIPVFCIEKKDVLISFS